LCSGVSGGKLSCGLRPMRHRVDLL
jgi:hypothetical protein